MVSMAISANQQVFIAGLRAAQKTPWRLSYTDGLVGSIHIDGDNAKKPLSFYQSDESNIYLDI